MTIKCKIWGYHRQDVDECLAQLKQVHEQDKANIHASIRAYRQEREQLDQALKDLTSRLDHYLHMQPVFGEGVEQLDAVCDIIERQAQQIIDEVVHVSQLKTASLQARMDQIKEAENELNLQMEQVFRGFFQTVDGLASVFPATPPPPSMAEAAEAALGAGGHGDGQSAATVKTDAPVLAESPQGEPEPAPLRSGPAPEPISASFTKPAPTPEMDSHAVSQEIQSLRYRYVVGKVVGQDLFDGQGLLIAAQGSVITDDIMEKAERAGKQVELIIHMQLPEMGE